MNKELHKWNASRGDETYRLNYKLNENSIVFDLGGYRGEWAQKIYDRYGCNIHVFEPHPEFSKNLYDKFGDNKKITVYDFGLYTKTTTTKLSDTGSSSSIITSDDGVDVKLVDIVTFLKNINISRVDLIKINIEGSEYELIDHLYQNDLLQKFDNLQIQFHHEQFENYEELISACREMLSQTHKMTWCFNWVWENWGNV